MSRKTVNLLCCIAVPLLTACVASPAGPTYRKTEGHGKEYELVGVVSGLWQYDQSENYARLRKYLPSLRDSELRNLAKLYQVRIGFKRRLIYGGKAAEVALLPEGWRHEGTPGTGDPAVVHPGDLVVALVQDGRLVDRVVSIYRRCDEESAVQDRPELDMGCFRVTEFGESGYGGKYYFWSAF